MSAHGQGLEGHSDRPRPADLDDPIDATAIGQLARLLVPIRRLGVVDHVGIPQRLEPLGLLRGRGCRNYPSTLDPGQLQRKDRDASRTLGENCTPGVTLRWPVNATQAITAAHGKVAASPKERWLGRCTSASSFNTAYSAASRRGWHQAGRSDNRA